MPVTINQELIKSLTPHLQKLNLKDQQRKNQFVTNVAYSFESEKELIEAISKLNASPFHTKLLSSTKHEVLFKNELLDLTKVVSLNEFQTNLLHQCPITWLSPEAIKLISYNGLDSNYFYSLVASLDKINQQETISHLKNIALFIAAENGNIEVVTALLATGANKEMKLDSGAIPLHIACQEGQLGILKILLDKNTDPDKPANGGITPLYLAAQNGHVEIVKALLAAGAGPNKARNDGVSPLYAAALEGYGKTVRALLNAGADPNKAMNDGKTLLYIAAHNGHVNVVKALVAAGADLNKSTNDGRTALYIAAQNGHVDVVKALVAAGADLNKAMDDGATPLFIACVIGDNEIVNILLAAGADKDKATNDEVTPLFIAAQHGHIKIVETLLAAGADKDKATIRGTTPIIQAGNLNYEEILILLLKNGADLNGIEQIYECNNSHSVKALLKRAMLVDKVYNLDIYSLTKIIKDPQKLTEVAKARLINHCQTKGLPEGFEARLKNLPNFTNQQKKQLRDIFAMAGKFKEDIFEAFESSYCGLLYATDPDNFPLPLPYSLLTIYTERKSVIDKDENADKAFESYNKNNFYMRPDNFFQRIYDPNCYKSIVYMVTKDINISNYEQRIEIGYNILESLDKLLIEAPYYKVLQNFKSELRNELARIENSINEQLHKTIDAQNVNIENIGLYRFLVIKEIASNKNHPKIITPAAAESPGFVKRLNNESSEKSKGV